MIKLTCKWNEKMVFTAESSSSQTPDKHQVKMDTKPPIGTDTAMTPKQLVLAGLCGCTAMDVVSLLRKYKEPLETLEMDAEAPTTDSGYPSVFKEVFLNFKLTGQLDSQKVLEAVKLSQTKYCGVSAMISKAAPIHYQITLNGKNIGSGKAQFS